ncbi:MAG: glycosyltransferase [Clostridia bacterium]|nr:glycosyltransferase [Clostridia bacterium]
MAKVSIIVPVYNTGKYVERCLNSIIKQTEKNEIELIVINDGSTDNSGEIIKEYITKQENKQIIKYYEKENEGIAKTRNLGVEKATGEYILFVDSDDYIDKQLIEKLKPYIDKKIDLIKFKLQRVDETGKKLEKVDGPTFENKTGEEAFNEMYSQDILLDSPCVYLIKKELFTQNNFQFKRTYHEDFGLIPLILLVAKSVASVNEYLYNYVQVGDSITRNEDYQKTIQRMEDCLAHYDNMIKTVEKLRVEKKTKENIKIYYTNAILLKLKELKPKERKKYKKEIQKRKFSQNIKARNLKQFIKKILLKIDIDLYLKMR